MFISNMGLCDESLKPMSKCCSYGERTWVGIIVTVPVATSQVLWHEIFPPIKHEITNDYSVYIM